MYDHAFMLTCMSEEFVELLCQLESQEKIFNVSFVKYKFQIRAIFLRCTPAHLKSFQGGERRWKFVLIIGILT